MIKEIVLNFQVKESLPGDTGGRRALGGLGEVKVNLSDYKAQLDTRDSDSDDGDDGLFFKP
jgi:hypothetical protein